MKGEWEREGGREREREREGGMNGRFWCGGREGGRDESDRGREGVLIVMEGGREC